MAKKLGVQEKSTSNIEKPPYTLTAETESQILWLLKTGKIDKIDSISKDEFVPFYFQKMRSFSVEQLAKALEIDQDSASKFKEELHSKELAFLRNLQFEEIKSSYNKGIAEALEKENTFVASQLEDKLYWIKSRFWLAGDGGVKISQFILQKRLPWQNGSVPKHHLNDQEEIKWNSIAQEFWKKDYTWDFGKIQEYLDMIWIE